jgi:hypothetical protein
VEKSSLNQAGGSSSWSTRREGIKSKEVKKSSQAEKCPDFLKLQHRGAEELKQQRDTSIEAFQRTFETDILPAKTNGELAYVEDIVASIGIKCGFHVTSKDNLGKGLYDNIIDVEGGKIIGVSNDKNRTKGWYLSDVIYNQLQLVLKEVGKDISQFDLESWYGYSISHADTKAVALKCLQGEKKKTFEAGSKEFNALKGNITAKPKIYLLEQHPDIFHGKQVVSVTVIRARGGRIDIDYAISDHLSS